MKVIRPGAQQSWSSEQQCTGAGNRGNGCGAMLLVEIDDLFITREFEREGGGTPHVTFCCALCEVLTDIENAPEVAWAAARLHGTRRLPPKAAVDVRPYELIIRYARENARTSAFDYDTWEQACQALLGDPKPANTITHRDLDLIRDKLS